MPHGFRSDPPAPPRRQFLRRAGAAGLGSLFGISPLAALADDIVALPFGNGERPLVKYPQKRALLRLTTRPPQLETPFAVFDENIITPNDAFFVRYHLAGIPTRIDPATYRLAVRGSVASPLSLGLDDLKKNFEPIEYVAVNQCSGNSRGFSEPRVPGGQSGNGAMGNARWRGVPLKTVLEKAGVQAGAKQVSFNGLDTPVLPTTPDFVKALDLDHALDGEVMLAYAMNGADLPMLNGYPLRLIVPGHYGTYWVKHLSDIVVHDAAFDGFWMAKAYRVPDNACACVEPGTAPSRTVPIGRFDVRSFITNVADGAHVKANRPQIVRGIAFDGGYGIREVLFSEDGGAHWRAARLGEDLGRYSFRAWTIETTLAAGPHALQVRALNRIGQSQPLAPLWNPPGYMRNVVETTHITAA
ncbi:MAG: molybdopterin-dependent oxidoreductase [Proteobacteria bacterium]|nr:molybdopterin-dependent oxidoreductase [Pseudomonadota bacterium]